MCKKPTEIYRSTNLLSNMNWLCHVVLYFDYKSHTLAILRRCNNVQHNKSQIFACVSLCDLSSAQREGTICIFWCMQIFTSITRFFSLQKNCVDRSSQSVFLRDNWVCIERKSTKHAENALVNSFCVHSVTT